jgi:hypothetical protein
MFAGLLTGQADYGFMDWLGALDWSAFGNLTGGLNLVIGLARPRLSDPVGASGAQVWVLPRHVHSRTATRASRLRMIRQSWCWLSTRHEARPGRYCQCRLILAPSPLANDPEAHAYRRSL